MPNAKTELIKGYHDLLRPEIARLIPTTAKKILDLGCGSGALAAHIKKRQACTYNGIENNQRAASVAKKHMDRVYAYDIEDHPLTNAGCDYDTLICADILEHLKNPWEILEHFTGELGPNGTIVASLPNIAHPAIAADLQRGLFRYREAGILDRTHLRFFTITSIFQMFSALNLKITKVIPSPSVDNPIQLLITAKKSPYYRRPCPATIIITSSSQPALLRATINSIRAHTKPNVRIIVVNNASKPETTTWIEQQDDILEIRCEKNLGFTTANNLGLEISKTPYTILCNDDILVTENWIEKLIDCAESDPNIGIVGPISNNVSGPQMDKTANYTTPEDLAAHVSRVTKENENKRNLTHRIVFFCTLIKKEVIDKIGHLDEMFSPGNFEDDDYCLRAIEAGFKCVIDRSTFIHHYGSQSWGKHKEEYKKIMQRNYTYFMRKWSSRLEKLLKLSLQ